MDTNDPPPKELPADPEAALRLLNAVNVPKLKQWCKSNGLTIKKNSRRAGILKVLIDYYEQVRVEAAAAPPETAGEPSSDDDEESSGLDAVDTEVSTEVADVEEVVVPAEYVDVVHATREKFADTDIQPVVFALELFSQKIQASLPNKKYKSIPVLEGKRLIGDLLCPVDIRCQGRANFKKDFYPTKVRLTNLIAMTNAVAASVGDYVDSAAIKDIEGLLKKRRDEDITDHDDVNLLEKYDSVLLDICGEDKELWRKVGYDIVLPSSEWGTYRSRLRKKVKNGVWDGKKLNDYSKSKLWMGFLPVVEKPNV